VPGLWVSFDYGAALIAQQINADTGGNATSPQNLAIS
jgi:hypothetical protein